MKVVKNVIEIIAKSRWSSIDSRNSKAIQGSYISEKPFNFIGDEQI